MTLLLIDIVYAIILVSIGFMIGRRVGIEVQRRYQKHVDQYGEDPSAEVMRAIYSTAFWSLFKSRKRTDEEQELDVEKEYETFVRSRKK